MRIKLITITFLLFALWGCSKQTATEGRAATIALKDGTTVTGTVVKSDTSSVTIQTSSGVVSTYPVSQVASINYGSGASAPAAGSVPGTDAATASGASKPTGSTPSTETPAGQPAPPPPAPASPAASARSDAPTATPAQPATNPGTSSAAAAREYHPDVTFRVVPAGTTVSVRTDQIIDSKTATPGQTYPGSVAHDVLDSKGGVAIPHGSNATLVIRTAVEQGRIKGQSELSVDVAAVQVNGRQYRLETVDYVEKGRQGVGVNKRTGEFAGGGGLLGTIVGAVAGGGKGAAIGAASGAAAGAATQSFTRGKGIRIPAETVLNFRLEAPIRIREMH